MMMRERMRLSRAGLVGLLFSIIPLSAHAFDTGSTGSLGAFAPVSNTTVTLPADGILNYTTVTIPSGVTVNFTRNTLNTPVFLVAQGDVTINGTVHVNGSAGLAAGPASAERRGFGWSPVAHKGGNGAARDCAEYRRLFRSGTRWRQRHPARDVRNALWGHERFSHAHSILRRLRRQWRLRHHHEFRRVGWGRRRRAHDVSYGGGASDGAPSPFVSLLPLVGGSGGETQ